MCINYLASTPCINYHKRLRAPRAQKGCGGTPPRIELAGVQSHCASGAAVLQHAQRIGRLHLLGRPQHDTMGPRLVINQFRKEGLGLQVRLTVRKQHVAGIKAHMARCRTCRRRDRISATLAGRVGWRTTTMRAALCSTAACMISSSSTAARIASASASTGLLAGGLRTLDNPLVHQQHALAELACQRCVPVSTVPDVTQGADFAKRPSLVFSPGRLRVYASAFRVHRHLVAVFQDGTSGAKYAMSSGGARREESETMTVAAALAAATLRRSAGTRGDPCTGSWRQGERLVKLEGGCFA